MTEPITITVRRATPEDAKLLGRLAADVFRETFAADNDPDNLARYLETAFSPAQMHLEIMNPANRFFLAFVDSQSTLPVGCAKLAQGADVPPCIADTESLELARFFVLSSWHGTGVAVALMEAVLAEAKSLAAKTIHLGVFPSNRRARRFYEKWGFVEAGTHFFSVGTEMQTDLIMTRPSATPPKL